MDAGAETKEVVSVGLYERLVGAGWVTLDEAVRRFHPSGKGVRAAGTFVVRRGRGPSARLLARLMRLPESGEAVPLLLRVTPHAGGERWRRSFAGRDFVTEQRAHAGRPAAGRSGAPPAERADPLPAERAGPLLAERAGPVEMLFRLKAEGGALVYTQEGLALRAGRLRVPLPRLLAPRVEASERAGRGGRGVRVFVRVTAPLVGLVIRYEGLVTTEEDAG
jgi:hypothetical protein